MPAICPADDWGGGMSVTVTELPVAEQFWTTRPVLEHVLEFARARRAGPWSVLVVVLARAIASIEPNVTTPPTVGAAMSLNLFAALVGASGSGKGASQGAGRAAVQFVDHNGRAIDTDEFPLGSGEGLARTFRPASLDDDEPGERTRALFDAPEVDTLTALGSRQGSTLMPELRKLYAGETCGFNNASKATRSVLPAHTYRACLTVGVQPAKAGALIHDADGGTPQRFVWMPVGDPEAPDTAPDCPQPWTVTVPRWGSDRAELVIPDTATRAMDRHRLASLRGEAVDPLDGHRMLTRLKVAAGLMVLDGRTVIDEEDWTLAGVIMRVSDRTRGDIERTLAERTRSANRARAAAKADEAEIIDDRAAERLCNRARGRLIRTLERRGTATRKDLRNNLDTPLRGVFDAVLADLVDESVIYETGDGYRLTG